MRVQIQIKLDMNDMIHHCILFTLKNLDFDSIDKIIRNLELCNEVFLVRVNSVTCSYKYDNHESLV